MGNQSLFKVAFLLPSLKFGGAERVALTLAKAMKALGIEIDFLLMSYQGEFLAEAEAAVNVVDLKVDKTYKLPAALSAYVLKSRPDMLISSFWKLNLCACLVKIRHPQLKLLLWEHSMVSRSRNSPVYLYAPTASILYRAADKIIAVSNGVRNDIVNHTFGLKDKIDVIYNPIAPPASALLDASKKESSLSETKQIIWIGRLANPKNPGLMLDAFRMLPNTCNAILTFVGEGSMRAELEIRCGELGLRERVKFLGFQPNPYEYLAKSDLLALSSDHEGLPSVMIEALYCGLRVVCTDCGNGVHEILENGRYGTIVPLNDSDALASAIESELLASADAKAQMVGALRFIPGKIAEQFLAASI